MTKLTVVYMQDTGHVLAALTRTDPPQGTEPVSALVGTSLLVRFIGNLPASAAVSAQDLNIATVDDQPGVVIGPQGFMVTFDPKGQAQVGRAKAANQFTLAIDTTLGATISGATVGQNARVGLQKVTPSGLPPTTLFRTTVAAGFAIVAPTSEFTSGDIWNMYALVPGFEPAFAQIPVL
jgi:hypothetical protein